MASPQVPDTLFTLFGHFADVMRVKILFKKKDTALVQIREAGRASLVVDALNGEPCMAVARSHRWALLRRVCRVPCVCRFESGAFKKRAKFFLFPADLLTLIILGFWARSLIAGVILKGKDLRLKISKHSEVKMPQDPADPSAYLTKDYLASTAHRFKNPGITVFPPSYFCPFSE